MQDTVECFWNNLSERWERQFPNCDGIKPRFPSTLVKRAINVYPSFYKLTFPINSEKNYCNHSFSTVFPTVVYK